MVLGGSGGVYEVQESGLEFKHGTDQKGDQTPSTPGEFLNDFRQTFDIRVLERPSEFELVLEFINVDVSFVNALRRILLSEVPTVAIETVYMLNNTSIIHDEVLAHRMGLIPLKMDARRLTELELAEDGTANATDQNTLVFRLAVSCSAKDKQEHEKKYSNKKAPVKKGENKVKREVEDEAMADNEEDGVAEDDNDDDVVVPKGDNPELEGAAAAASRVKTAASAIPKRPYTKHVYSSDLQWIPQGDQAERWEGLDIRPVHEDILIAKLRPGQEIEVEAHARRGIGKDHAKWSPVATASYRLYTHIELLEPVYDDLAEELVHIYEPGVFELVPTNTQEGDPASTKVKAKVCNSYACTMSRNYMRNPQLARAIRMVRVPDRFIFSIESVGVCSPAVLLAEALRVLQKKCRRVRDLADQTIQQSTEALG